MRVKMESRYSHWKIGGSDNIGFPEIMVARTGSTLRVQEF